MTTVRRSKRLKRDIMPDLPTDILLCIYEYLNGCSGLRQANLFRPAQARECCHDCRQRLTAAKQDKLPWSPWILTQLSTRHNMLWRSFYHRFTFHKVCAPQMNDYMTTFLGGGGKVLPDSRKGPPVYYVFVTIISETISRVSLHKFYETEASFVRYGSVFGSFTPPDGWRKGSDSRRRRKKTVSVFRSLWRLRTPGLSELLPGPDGAGKLSGIFLDQAVNLWLNPTPDYLASNTALDANFRKALYEMWSSMNVRSIYLLVLPSRTDGEGIRSIHDQCEVSHPFWKQHPHKSHIQSVQSFSAGKRGYGFIVKPYPYVLPEGYNFQDIGINKQELRAEGGPPVYLELVSPNDDEFHIQLEGPLNYFYEQPDDDFVGDVDEK